MSRDKDVAEFHAILLEEERTAEKGFLSIKEGTFREGQKDATGEFSAYDQHPAEIGTDTFEREKDLGLKQGLEEHLLRIGNARRRISTGDYWYCVSCGKEIPRDRLRAVPTTEMCLECQSREEAKPYPKHPVEESVIDPRLMFMKPETAGRNESVREPFPGKKET